MIRPKKKSCVVQVTWPSLFLGAKNPNPKLYFFSPKKVKPFALIFYVIQLVHDQKFFLNLYQSFFKHQKHRIGEGSLTQYWIKISIDLEIHERYRHVLYTFFTQETKINRPWTTCHGDFRYVCCYACLSAPSNHNLYRHVSMNFGDYICFEEVHGA